MTDEEKYINEAYLFLRNNEEKHKIPVEFLDLMKYSAMEKLNEDKSSIYYGDMEDSIYTKKGKKRLWKEENIIYVGGVHAFKVKYRPTYTLIELFEEDDGQLFSDGKITFDVGWLKDLRKLIEATMKKLNME